MKGVVFTEFFNMVETETDYGRVDMLIEKVKPENDGAYTAVGTYDHAEIVNYVIHYAQSNQEEIGAVLYRFGQHLFQVFNKGYGQFFEPKTVFDFFTSIDEYIHVEVKKLYPDAQLPRFETTRIDDKIMEMLYISDRQMADLAHGLIDSSLDFYKSKAQVQRTNLSESGDRVLFRIKLED